MNGTEERMRAGVDVDRALAAMSAETPEMPAGFHAAWTRAVEEEMRRAAANDTKKTEKTAARGRRTQWIRLAGVAAMMVFLLGGTMLTRGRWTGNQANRDAGARMKSAEPAVMGTAIPAGEAMLPAPEILAAPEPLMASEALSDAEMMAAPEADLSLASAPAALTAAGKSAEPSADRMDALEVPDSMMAFEAAEEDAAENLAEEEPAEEMTGAEHESVAANSAPESETEEAAPATAAVEMESGTAAEEPAAGFWEDLVQFALHTWPVLAGLAVAWGVLAWIRGSKKRKARGNAE